MLLPEDATCISGGRRRLTIFLAQISFFFLDIAPYSLGLRLDRTQVDLNQGKSTLKAKFTPKHSRSLTGSGNFIPADLPGNTRRHTEPWDERRHRNSAYTMWPQEHRMKTGTQGELIHLGTEGPCIGGSMHWSQRAA